VATGQQLAALAHQGEVESAALAPTARAWSPRHGNARRLVRPRRAPFTSPPRAEACEVNRATVSREPVPRRRRSSTKPAAPRRRVRWTNNNGPYRGPAASWSLLRSLLFCGAVKRLDTPRYGQSIGTCRSRSSFKLIGGRPRSGRKPDKPLEQTLPKPAASVCPRAASGYASGEPSVTTKPRSVSRTVKRWSKPSVGCTEHSRFATE